MRYMAVLVIASLAASSVASFEMVLVADDGQNTVATRKIHRFDPVSGVYLGSFGGFNASITSTYLNQSTNSLFVMSANGFTEWNYNTGLLKNSIPYPLVAAIQYVVRPSGDRIAIFDNLADVPIFSFPTFSSLQTHGLLPGALYRSGIWTSNTSMIAFESAQSRFVNLSFNAAGTTSTTGVVSNVVAATTRWGQMAKNGGTNQVVMATGTLGGFYSYAPNGTTFTNNPGVLAGNALSAASAHSGFFIGYNTGAATGRVDYFDGNRNYTRSFGIGQVVSPVSMQTVLAPEPGTMAIFGLGLAALKLRRKRS